jgi:hypothetical protein
VYTWKEYDSLTTLYHDGDMETTLPTIAGFISTALFAVGTLPMLADVFRAKSLA